MNRLIYVFGHPRSGNNFLMAILALNFYNGINLETTEYTSGSNFVTDDGKIQHHNKWGKIFGGHHFRKPPHYRNADCIYIKRTPMDVVYSFWRRKQMLPKGIKGISFKDFLSHKMKYKHSHNPNVPIRIIDNVISHQKSWNRPRIYTVSYEDLCCDPVTTIKKIARHFKLIYEPPIKLLTEKVGWNPRKGVPREGVKAANGLAVVRGPHRGRKGSRGR